MREFSNHAVLSMSDSAMAVSSKYTQDLSVQIVLFPFSCKWFLCFYFWAVIWSYTVDLFAALHELASAGARTLPKLASSARALLKPYGDTLILCQAFLAATRSKQSVYSKQKMERSTGLWIVNYLGLKTIFVARSGGRLRQSEKIQIDPLTRKPQFIFIV